MSNPITDLNLGYGVRCIVGKSLRAKLTSMSYVAKSDTLTQINGSSSPVDCALKFTETSATTIVLFCLLSVITLGIYLLCTLHLTNYIAKDSGSWYNLALRSLTNPPQDPPTPDPTPKDPAPPGPAPANEISQLEPEDEEEEEGPRLPIPEENPLKAFCAVFFEQREHCFWQDGEMHRSARGVYECFANIRFDSNELDQCIVEIDKSVSIADNPILKLVRFKGQKKSLPKLRLDIPGGIWNAFIGKLRTLYLVRGANKFYLKRNKYIAQELHNSLQWKIQTGIMTGVLVSKIREIFLRELFSAVDNPPLNKFFTMQQSTIQSKAFTYVRELIHSCLGNLLLSLFRSTAESSQDCLRKAKIDWIGNTEIDEISEKLSLERNAADYEDGDEGDVADAFNKLLGRLGATVRKLLRETPFEFDGSEMTISQYFDAMAVKWDGKIESGNGKTNGALLAEAKADADAQMAEFLTEIADKDVQQFLADNAPKVAEP